MLRMRPKPPAGLPTINAGTPWSAMDMADLQLKLIAEMERLGHDRAAAESLLALFEEIQRMHQQHRQAIIRELDELDPPLPPQRTGGASG